MRIIALTLGIIAGLQFTGWALEDNAARYDNLFQMANEAYEQGEYDTAVSLYSQVVNAGYSSARLYYNLGNAFFKSEQLAPAILYYEKAAKLAPADGDIRFNLEMANSQIYDKIESVPTPFLEQSWSFFRNLLSARGWGVLTLICFTGFLALLAFYLITPGVSLKRISFFGFMVLLFLAIIGFVAGQSARNYILSKDQAIVFSPSLNVKAEPKNSSADLFVIHEGTKVSVLEQNISWSRVALPNGNEGWVPTDEIEPF
ncbi:tetratricopeptide repeat protein [bacterium SCSIO 12741]|nr:tetratricopeptide repeat protein [bacterium SCSIO 12741]